MSTPSFPLKNAVANDRLAQSLWSLYSDRQPRGGPGLAGGPDLEQFGHLIRRGIGHENGLLAASPASERLTCSSSPWPTSVSGRCSAPGSCARRLDRWDVADSLIGLAAERGFEDNAVRWSRSQALGRGDWDRAETLCDSLLAEPSSPRRLESDQRSCGSIDLARGRVRKTVSIGHTPISPRITPDGRTIFVCSRFLI